MIQRQACLAVVLVATIFSPIAFAEPPEFTWVNQFAGFPERVLRNAEPDSNGFVGSTGSRTIPMPFRAPDGSLECHVLIRYENGQWTTTGDVGLAGPDNCGFISGATPIRDVTPFGSSICIGGNFTNLGTDGLNYFACHTAGGVWQQVGGPGNGPNSTVEVLAYDGVNVYLGGSFTEVNGNEAIPTSARRIVRTGGVAWEPLFSDNAGTSDGVNSTVNAILPTSSFIYAGVGSGVRRWSSGANDKWSDLGSSNTTTVRDIELNGSLLAAVSSGATLWGGRAAGAVSEYDGGSMEWSAVGSSSGINTGSSALAVAQGFFHATGNFTAIDPDARGVARLNASLEWEAVPDSAALGDFPSFLDLMQVGGDLCGVQQGQFTGAQFFSRGISCNDGTKWRGLAQGIQGQVFDLIKYDGAIVAGGEISAAGDTLLNYIAEYRDGEWNQLGGGLVFTGANPSAPGDVRAMTIYKGDLYVMGLFNEADGEMAPGLARWDGQNWHAVGEGINFPGDIMLEWNGQLIIFGTTPSNEGPILSWDGTSFTELPDLPGFRSPTAMAVYNGELIAAYRPSSSAHIARFTGTGWERITDVAVQFGGDINALLVRGNELYAGGSFTAFLSGQPIAEQVAKWNGNTWSAMGDGLEGSIFGVEEMIFADDAIIAIGWFETSGSKSVEGLAYYDGAEWYPLGPGLFKEFTGSSGRTVMRDINRIYIGGFFEQAGNVWADNIAAFDLRTNLVHGDGFEGN